MNSKVLYKATTDWIDDTLIDLHVFMHMFNTYKINPPPAKDFELIVMVQCSSRNSLEKRLSETETVLLRIAERK